MRLSKLLFVVIVSLLVGLLCVTWSRAVAETAKVEGYVYSADATTPMVRVKVIVFYADGKSAQGETNEKGYYSVPFTKNNRPIEVRYIPEQQILFPELKGLSGSTTHTISRTQESGSGNYSSRRVIELHNSAQGAMALMVKMPANERQGLEKYYRGMLDSVRVEQRTVPDEATREFLQSTYDKTRHQYGLPPETLKNENGVPLKAFLDKRRPPGDSQFCPEYGSCMTAEVLGELLSRVCREEPPSIAGLSPAAKRDLRLSLRCQPGSRGPLRNDDAPKRQIP